MKKIGAIILAAGLSSRMKENKLLLPLEGKAMIAHTVERFLASGVAKTYVVVGNDRDKISKELAAYPVDIIDNPDYHTGMSASVKAGIRLALECQLDGAMICPGDMPFVQTATIDQILAAYNSTGAGIIVPVYQDRRGHPVFFAQKFFREILEIDGDVGARYLLGQHPEAIYLLEVADPGMHIDIDSKEIYQALSGEQLGRLLRGMEK